MIFQPNRDQVRRFFMDAWEKHSSGAVLEAIEGQAVQVMLLHPEYHSLLGHPEDALHRDYSPEGGQMNPFLHLSLHLAAEEQLGIDQPAGICDAFSRLLKGGRSRHEALHIMLECLGNMMWQAQRDNSPPDGEAYLECLRRSF